MMMARFNDVMLPVTTGSVSACGHDFATAGGGPKLLHRQMVMQRLPLLLTDPGNRQQFLHSFESASFFPEGDNSLRQSRTDTWQRFQLLWRRSIEIDR